MKAPTRRPARQAPPLRDAAIRLLDRALEEVAGTPSDERVHTARKTAKRLRAALRLLRGALGTRAYRRQNRLVRDAAKPLTSLRDAFVLLRTLRDLKVRAPRLEQELEAEYQWRREQLDREALSTTASLLRTIRDEMLASPYRQSEVASAAAGIRKVYKAGRRAFREARSGEDDALHEWRKQVKYLANELLLMRDIFETGLKRVEKRADRLAELLGEDHDLAVLAATMHRHRCDDKHLERAIRSRRRLIQRTAWREGKRLYQKSPRKVATKIGRRLPP